VEELMSERERAPRRGRSGFTLIEVVISSAILAVGLLTVAAMQLHALRAGASGRDLTNAATVARDQMEVVQRMAWASVTPTGWTAPPWINVPGYAAGQVPILVDSAAAGPLAQQVYNVQWRVTNVGGQPDLRNVDLQIRWNEPNRPNHTLMLSSVRWNDK
jgi:prepilin-type N-terminal cleavage/methylation domain-containing protein